ncbi:MAG TPA: endonuclease/exonuclease/phosphatase family protein [Candidatus Hydrogenedentes bacterium]|nr:endonuclease/exonuclease/phosphatase family protein [Candidatus Hydrogenedentota bacterium]
MQLSVGKHSGLWSRRRFLVAAGAVLPCAVLAGPRAEETGAAPPEPRFRTITYNAREGEGWGLRPEQQARLACLRPQLPQRMALELALYAPDAVTLVEAPSEAAVAEMAEVLDMEYRYSHDASPGALLTRCKIVEWDPSPEGKNAPYTKQQRPKHCARAVIETAIGRVTLYGVHYTARRAERRIEELRTTLDIIAGDVASGGSFLLQGDLNHSQRTPEYAYWTDAGLEDAFRLKGAGIEHTLGTAQPTMRIDYVWLHGPITERLVECRVLFEGAFRTNPEDPSSVALSDHLPLMATFG